MTIPALALPFEFDQPQWLWLCLLIPVLALVSRRSLAGLERGRRWAAIAMRVLVVLFTAACLAGVEHVQRNDDLTVMFLMDRSYSVRTLQTAQEDFIRDAARRIPPRDRLGMIDFARNAFLQQLPMAGGYYLPPGRLPAMPNDDQTDIAAGLRLAMAMFPHDTAKRIVLMTDGNDNRGDVIAEARRAGADGIPIDVVPLWYEHRNEVYFDRIIAPAHAEAGEQIPLRMVLNSHRAVRGTIQVYCNGTLVEMPDADRRVQLQPGTNTFFLKLPVRGAVTQAYEAVFQPDDESMDAISLNNRAHAFTFVSSGSRALLITPNPDQDAALAQALMSEQVAVDMKTPDELGEFDLADMMSYSALILANTPAATFTDEQQQAMAVYVKDMGSGLIMTGGDEGFGAGGWIGSPLEEIMPVSFEIKHKRVIPRGALVLIMHSCEIPRGNYWAKEMGKKSVDTISAQDYLGVIAYSYTPSGESWEVPLGLNTNKSAVKARIDRMQVGDMPDFGPPMQMAYDELIKGRGRDAAQRHVIIFSDGDATPPAARMLQDFADSKITVSTVGIGWGQHVMTSTLQDVARKTGGNFYAAQNAQQLPQIFSKESKVVRRPLIVDEPFQPAIAHANSELLAGLGAGEAVPPLDGMILTTAKESPNVLVPLVRMTDDGDDPVLAHWQYELGKTAAFTSGFWPVWGREWTQWPKFAKFWAQIVRWTMRQDTPANFDSYTRVEGNQARIVIDALDKDAGYLNNLMQKARVIGPDNKAIPARFIQTGPGKYEAVFEVDKAGPYLANVQMLEGNRNLGTLRTGLSVPFSAEYRDLKPNEALLRQVAETTGGRWLDGGERAADVFSHDLKPTETKRPAWEWVLSWLLLPAFLLDVAVRRLASTLALSVAVELVILVVLLFGVDVIHGTWWGILGAFVFAELVGWTMRRRYIRPLFEILTHGITATAQAGDRSAVSLEKLKTTRDRVREGQRGEPADGRPAERTAQPEPPAISLSTSRRRHDVGESTAKQPVGDLHEALGGAKATAPPVDKKRKPAPSGEGAAEDEATTSRLLKAKRRAQEDKK